MDDLRDYQVGAISNTRRELADGKKRVAIYSPTGSGKTVIAEAIIRSALSRGKRVAFLANRVNLVQQTSRRLANIAHGILQGENTYGVNHDLIIGSIQTVARRGLPPVDLIIIDEAHGVPGSKDYLKVIAAYNNVPVIGLTATPFSRGMAKHHDGIGGPVFEALVVAATIRDLIDAGFLVDCDIYAPSGPDLSSVKVKRNQYGELDYAENELAAAVDQPKLIGDIISHWFQLGNNKPTVCFATNIAHSKHIVEQFLAAGVSAEHIDCYTSEEDRKAILQRVLDGKTKVISNVGILCEGWDFPACEVMILARPTKSLIRWIQMCGRILRPFPGKVRGTILDHSNSSHELGYPTDDLPLELCDGTLRSSETKQKPDKPEPKPKKCEKCHFMKPPRAHACPKCGHVNIRKSDIDHEDGELKKVERKKKPTAQEKQEWWSGFLFIAAERNKPKSWAYAQYKQKFGVWPRVDHDNPIRPSDEVYSWERSRRIAWAKGKQNAQQHS